MLGIRMAGSLEDVAKAILVELMSASSLVTLLTGRTCESVTSVRTSVTELMSTKGPEMCALEWKTTLLDLVSKLVVVGRLLFEQSKNYAEPTSFEVVVERLTSSLDSYVFHPQLQEAA